MSHFCRVRIETCSEAYHYVKTMFLITANRPYSLFLRAFFIVIFVSFDKKHLGTCKTDLPIKPNCDLCVNYSKSCDHQAAAFNLSDFECQMIWKSSSSEVCNDESFKRKGRTSKEYDKMNLLSYLYTDNDHRIPSFNVTFSEIKWKRLRMRYVENRANVTVPSLCREFEVNNSLNNIPSAFTLFFDCLWHSTGIGGKVFRFQYLAITPDDYTFLYDYVFRAPDKDRIDVYKTNVQEWELFLVVDMTDVPRSLTLRVQPVPDHLNVTWYFVKLFRQLSDTSWAVDNWTRKHPATNGEKQLLFYYETKSNPGDYYFSATFEHPNCTPNCPVYMSPIVTLVDMPDQMKLIAVVGIVILVPILLTAYFIWRRKCYSKVQTPESVGPPKMLLMYNPVSIQHVRVMMEITNYFRSCRLLAMLDQFDIPQSEHRDPVQWYREAFDDADFVGIFASPKTSAAENEAVRKYSRYLHTETIAMSQLRTKLILPGARCKFFCIALPGTNWDTLPPEAQALKRYTLPRDLDPLLVLVGLVPQCDHGSGFETALAAANAPETPVTIPVPPVVPTAINPGHQQQAPPTPPSASPHESRPNHTPHQQHNSNDDSCCIDEAFSFSDQELVSSSQPYLSDTGSWTSSLDSA